MNFAFISRHTPTQEQINLANELGITLTPIGDADAFTVSPSFVNEAGDFDGVVIVHPAAAMRLAGYFLVGVFENGIRPMENEKPQFFAKAFHVYEPTGLSCFRRMSSHH